MAHPYPHQNTTCDASIEAWEFEDRVCIQADIGELATFNFDFDAEEAWRLANDIADAARKASPELITTLEKEKGWRI